MPNNAETGAPRKSEELFVKTELAHHGMNVNVALSYCVQRINFHLFSQHYPALDLIFFKIKLHGKTLVPKKFRT